MTRSRRLGTAALAAMTTLLGACGGGGDAAPAPAASAPVATAFQNSVLLGSMTTQSLSFVPAGTTTNAAIVSTVAAPLVVQGSTALISAYLPAADPGAGIACVSAPTNSIGTITGVNTGVNIKSVAVLLDTGWIESNTPAANWSAFGTAGAIFDGWENCGAKAEGSPSPSSTLTVNTDGSFSDNVFDGNPSTTVSIINQGFTAAQAAQMLSSAGYLDTVQPNNPQRLYLTVYQNVSKLSILVEQGIPTSGASSANPGYVAIYFQR